LQPVATLRNLPPGFAIRAAVDGLVPRTPAADTFDEVVRAGLGPTMADRFYGPYARKLWGLAPTEIAGEQARRRVGASSPGAVLQRVLRGADPEARTFLYPRRGFGQLWEALADSASEAGADIRLSTTVTGVESTDDGVVVTTDRGGRVEAARAWSTIPLPVLAGLHPAPPAVRAAAASLRTRAMLLVYLVLPVGRWTPFDAHYLPEAWTPITRISEPTNYRDGHPGPEPARPTDPGDPNDRTVLCAELPCDVGDRYWNADDDDLAEVVTAAIDRAGLTCPDPFHVQTHRLPSAYPVYDLGFEDHLAVLDQWARSLPGILSFGRQGLFVHDNSHHALSMAWAAADALSPDGFDAASWAAARDRFASHVVED
ncbi:MAG TPA: FAD-dependent oxidoreductase, partial [Nitriliruptoraceae bacterium]|nr:FAD-dependent oxidoreductase [Nitriliruptoraceae bacterium]